MPYSNIDHITERFRVAEAEVQVVIEREGLDFVLRVCSKAATEREASHRAVLEFTKTSDGK